MIVKYKYDKAMSLFIIISLVLSLIPAPAMATSTTQASLAWSKSLTSSVNTVDTNEDGTIVFAGLTNGTIVSYDSSGSLRWFTPLNGSITKLRTVPDGSKIIAMNNLNQSYYIDGSNGSVIKGIIMNSTRNVSDIGISRDGNYFMVSGSSWVSIFDNNGSPYASNYTFAAQNWSISLQDPYNQYIIVANGVNKTFRWNTSSILGWDNINVLRDIPKIFNYENKRIIYSDNPNSQTIYLHLNASPYTVENASEIYMNDSYGCVYGDIVLVNNGSNTQYGGIGYNISYNKSPSSAANRDGKGFIRTGDANMMAYGGISKWINVSNSTNKTADTMIIRYLTSQPLKLQSGRIISLHNQTHDIYYSDNNGQNWSVLNNSASIPMKNYSVGYATRSFTLLNSSFPNGVRYVMYPTSSTFGSNHDIYISSDLSGSAWDVAPVKVNEKPYEGRYGEWNANLGYKFYAWGGKNITMDYKNDTVYTVDGYTWTRISSAANLWAEQSSGQDGFQQYYFNGYFYKFSGYNGYGWNYGAFRSTDAITWTNITASVGSISSGTAGGQFCVGPYNGRFYMADTYSTLTTWNSADGLSWSSVGSNQAPFGYTSNGGACTINSTSHLTSTSYDNADVYINKPAGNFYVDMYYNKSGTGLTPTYNTSAKTIDSLLSGYVSQESYKKNIWYLVNDTFATIGTTSSAIQAMDIPELGGWIGISTSEPKIYHQQITSAGFGTTQYSGSANSGTSRDIVIADSASYSAEARDLIFDIYQLDGTRKGTYTTGGTVRSIDFAVKNGLWACAGGDDGKYYVFSKDSTSAWYVYYQGDSGTVINTVAMSWRGEYGAVGRSDGTLEYYNLQSATSSSAYYVDTFVTKGGLAYTHVNMSVEKSDSYPYSFVDYTSGITDSTGKYSFEVEDGKYYRITVNSGEYSTIYQASSTYKLVTINIPQSISTRPYLYTSGYNETTRTMSINYQDVNNVIFFNTTWYNLTSGTMVKQSSYSGVSTVTDTLKDNTSGNYYNDYKVIIEFTRTTGQKYTDTMYIKSNYYNKIPGTTDQYVVFKYGVFTLLLMGVSLAIGGQSIKYGAVALIGIAVLGLLIGFLPWSIYTVGVMSATAIALMAVFRRRGY